MYYFTFIMQIYTKITYRIALITNFHTSLDEVLIKKLHHTTGFSLFFTLFRVKIIDNTTITPNTNG